MKQIRNAMKHNGKVAIELEYHKLWFYGEEKMLLITPLSATSYFHWKIPPMKVSYMALEKLLDEDFDGFEKIMEENKDKNYFEEWRENEEA